jgi:hypothetical protein
MGQTIPQAYRKHPLPACLSGVYEFPEPIKAQTPTRLLGWGFG